MKRMNFRRPGGNERCGTCDDEAPGRRALHTMDRMARRARALPLPGCFALRSDRLFPRQKRRENAVQGERDFDFPLPLKIPSP